ncbi:PREDICTED: non-secretory ribonuclease [Ceratotherium simum simum]|uniref:Non-secretory ribonuclease n=1 Tax=Ceratotherium simum simum TaxID=73337 RepID=A0ABM0H8V2_CERSS|nr:PREDICTED: non-secretory ribonuclease [Ceratotherium simum simum]
MAQRLGSMVPTQQDSWLCLLLLLGLLGMVISFHVPRGLTGAQWFAIQHINMTHDRCDDAMRVVNWYRNRCKDENTFLNTTFAFVANVCRTANVSCSNGLTNCHNSPVRVNITYCNLTAPAPQYTKCRYVQTQAQMYFRVACNNSSPGDNGTYPVVPVHLDAIF